MKTQSNRKKDLTCLSIIYLCYILVLLVTSAFTSPLYPHYYGDDSALFSLLGKGILEGKILYVDLFDHKGPIIFFINALGQQLGGYNGIFFLQTVFGLVSLTFLYYTSKKLESKDKTVAERILFFILVYAVYFYLLQQGNRTEEYAQPFISAALFLFVKYATGCKENSEHVSHPPFYALCYGVILGCLAFLRLNDAVTVCAGILAIFIFLIYKKKYANLLKNLLAGIAGMALVAVPICLYFRHHGALYDMLYGTFLYNFKIVGQSGKEQFLDHIFKFTVLYLPIAISCILLVAHLVKERKIRFLDFLLGCILLFNIIIFCLANRYPHYFASFVPAYLVFLFRYFTFNKKKVISYIIVVCTIVNLLHAGFYAALSFRYCHIIKQANVRYCAVKSITDAIPESERDSVIGFNIPVSYYVLGDIIPCYKYYTWQWSWSRVDPQILVDFHQWVRTEKPLWILVTPREANPELSEILHAQYEMIAGNDSLISFRLKETE